MNFFQSGWWKQALFSKPFGWLFFPSNTSSDPYSAAYSRETLCSSLSSSSLVLCPVRPSHGDLPDPQPCPLAAGLSGSTSAPPPTLQPGRAGRGVQGTPVARLLSFLLPGLVLLHRLVSNSVRTVVWYVLSGFPFVVSVAMVNSVSATLS